MRHCLQLVILCTSVQPHERKHSPSYHEVAYACSDGSQCSWQAARYAAGVRRFDFDAGMAPYNLASYGSWQALTGHIAAVCAAFLPKLLPHCTLRGHVQIWSDGRMSMLCTHKQSTQLQRSDQDEPAGT